MILDIKIILAHAMTIAPTLVTLLIFTYNTHAVTLTHAQSHALIHTHTHTRTHTHIHTNCDKHSHTNTHTL